MSIQRGRSAETRRRISHGLLRFNERKRLAARILPRDLVRLRDSGTVAESLRPVLDLAENEMAEIIESLGGADAVPPTMRALIEDAVSVGVALRGELGRYLQSGDPDAASRVGTLAAARRQSLALIGLEPPKDEAPALDAYIRTCAGDSESRP